MYKELLTTCFYKCYFIVVIVKLNLKMSIELFHLVLLPSNCNAADAACFNTFPMVRFE